MRFEFGPTDGPDVATAEALQAIARELERIADVQEGEDVAEALGVSEGSVNGDLKNFTDEDFEFPPDQPDTYSVDVHVDADEWARIYSRTWDHYQDTGEPVAAFRAAVDEVLTLEPTVLVCGQEKGPWDVDGIPLPEVDDE